MAFDTLTTQLNTLISTSNDWSAVSGGLDKVSASAMGFAWALGNSKVWLCQLPCNGDWKQVAITDAASITDITTDDLNVYVLYQTSQPTLQLAMKTASNVDDWITVKVPTGIQKIVSTSSYIWGQSGTQKWKLPKPGTTGNWIAVSDPLNIKITSASSTSLYGVDASGSAMKSDESLQTGWAIVPALQGTKYSAVLGDADQSTIYGIDSMNHLRRCMDGKCSPVSTQGYVPQNLTVEPVSKQLWMTTTTPGESGNVFTKTDSNNYSDILQPMQIIDKERDDVVQTIEHDYTQGTGATVLSKQLEIVKNLFMPKSATPMNIRTDATLKYTESEIAQMKKSMQFICDILLLVLVVIVIYMIGSVLGTFVHSLAFIVLAGGIVYLYNISKNGSV